MDPKKLQRVVVDALDDIKAQDVRVFDTTAQTELFDRVIIATGTSNRQTRALASHVRDKVKEAGAPVVSMEGADTGEWVLVDLGDIVVHVMQPAIRQYYNLEELWGAKPVRMRITARAPTAAGTRSAVATPAKRAAKGPAEPSAKAPAKRAAKAPTKTTEKASAKAPAKAPAKTAAKRTAAKGAATKGAPAKGAAAKRPAAKRAATKRASNG